MPDFDFAVLGAGAMGSIVGGHLARAGHSVVMLARGERAQQLERHGLTIKGLVAFSTPVTTLREPAALKSAGALIVAMKTPATAAALAALRHADFGVTLSIQNGPLKNELLAQAFGKERVLGALADTSGELLPDGAVLFTRNVSILVGELSGGEPVRRLRDAGGRGHHEGRARISDQCARPPPVLAPGPGGGPSAGSERDPRLRERQGPRARAHAAPARGFCAAHRRP